MYSPLVMNVYSVIGNLIPLFINSRAAFYNQGFTLVDSTYAVHNLTCFKQCIWNLSGRIYALPRI